jgi:hypothetical protein
MDTKAPSLRKIITTDYAAFVSLISILVAVGILAYDFLTGNDLHFTNQWLYITVAVGVIAVSVILWRVRLITSVFEYGWEVEGDLADLSFFRDRGRVSYVYTVQGQRFRSSNAISRNRFTRALQRGQKVMVIVHRDNPKVAFLHDLYAADG